MAGANRSPGQGPPLERQNQAAICKRRSQRGISSYDAAQRNKILVSMPPSPGAGCRPRRSGAAHTQCPKEGAKMMPTKMPTKRIIFAQRPLSKQRDCKAGPRPKGRTTVSVGALPCSQEPEREPLRSARSWRTCRYIQAQHQQRAKETPHGRQKNHRDRQGDTLLQKCQ